jgi:hypothetical protein
MHDEPAFGRDPQQGRCVIYRSPVACPVDQVCSCSPCFFPAAFWVMIHSTWRHASASRRSGEYEEQIQVMLHIQCGTGSQQPGESLREASRLHPAGGSTTDHLSFAYKLYEAVGSPYKQLKILTAAEGGTAHCQLDNIHLAHYYIFDWLADVVGD